MKFSLLLLHYRRIEIIQRQSKMLQDALGKYASSITVCLDFYTEQFTQEMFLELSECYDNIVVSSHNKGLSKSVIDGVNLCLETSDYVLVIEDDLFIRQNIEGYIDMSLEMLEKSDLAGVSLFAPFSGRSGFYLSGRPTSWGWITCRNSWPGNEMSYDWFVLNWKSMKIFDKINMFILLGLDLYRMGNRAVAKSNDSWFIRYVLYSYIRGYKFITPGFSLVENFGTEMSPTHGSKKPFPFYTPLLIFNSINRINMNRLYRIFVTLQYTRLVKACISISKKYVKVYFSKRG